MLMDRLGIEVGAKLRGLVRPVVRHREHMAVDKVAHPLCGQRQAAVVAEVQPRSQDDATEFGPSR